MVVCFIPALLAAAVNVVPTVRSTKITDAKLPPEGYRIRIDAAGKTKVEFADEAGWFYANQTLDQLPKDAKNLEIEDWPAYRWRGVMLDEGRHFFGKEAVKDILARMSALKMNVFHWHLTEDQGWRLDIPGMPELVKYGAVRPCSWKQYTENESDGKPYGPFFYTPEDVREIVKYAKGMKIRVIPEIELPGHTRALLAAHPEFSCTGTHPRHPWTETGVTEEVLCAGNDEAIRYLERVFDKVVEIFPDEVVHIGVDECPKARWKAVTDSRKPEMAFVRVGPLRDVESAAVVRNGELEPVLRPPAGDADGRRPAVANGVGRQFAQNAKDGVGGRVVKVLA